jgi:hypothetical protein
MQNEFVSYKSIKLKPCADGLYASCKPWLNWFSHVQHSYNSWERYDEFQSTILDEQIPEHEDITCLWFPNAGFSSQIAYFSYCNYNIHGLDVEGTVSRDFFFCLRFFHQTIPTGPLIHGLKPFWILLRIRRDMIDFERKNRACGVNDTAYKKIFFLR